MPLDSESDDRVKNNDVRHKYRVLTDAEKAEMVAIKDLGQTFINTLRNRDETREITIAIQKIEEAVMWAVKDITR